MTRKDRITMAYQEQIFELYERGYSIRRIAESLKMCRKSVKKYVLNFQQKKINETTSLENASSELKVIILNFPEWFQKIDYEHFLNEKRKGVPISVLYKEGNFQEITYWNFWSQLNRLDQILNPNIPKITMKLKHNPGEKCFVDYGDGINIVNPQSGEVNKTWIFVGTLPFSSKVYAEFIFDQKISSFIGSHERMWKYFGGVTKYVVSDNLKSAVTKSHIYDPEINKSFCAYANHAGFAVLPARPRKPKDKANVECHVGILQRSFFQEIRNVEFNSISNLNNSLIKYLNDFNNKIMKDYGVSRNDRFSEEISFLQKIPNDCFIIPEVRDANVHLDCHVQFKRCLYSVPWKYAGKNVRVIATGNRVEIFDLSTLERISLHSLSKKPGERKTDELHWPPEKREHCDFTLERAKKDAEKVGPKTLELLTFLFDLPRPLQYLRRSQAWLRNVYHTKYSRDGMEYAASMAMQHRNFSFNYINNCVDFFERGGLETRTQTGAPKRNLSHVYLQK